MKVAVGCLICSEFGGCECQSLLVRFLELIETGINRVSSSKVTSLTFTSNTSPRRGCIDKLEARINTPLTIEQILEFAQKSGLSVKDKNFGRQSYLQIGDSGTFFRTWRDAGTINQLISKPSAFADFDAYRDHLASLIGCKNLESVNVTRVDFTADFQLPFAEMIKRIDVKGKQYEIEHTSRSGTVTGLRIGKGHDKIIIYDKQTESKLDHPLTRIERQLSGKKLPSKRFNELFERARTLEPFNDVEIFDLKYIDEYKLSSDQLRDLHRLNDFVNQLGFLQARKKLDDQGNFQRDYARFFTKEMWPEQVNTVFRTSMKNFFNQKGNNDGPTGRT